MSKTGLSSQPKKAAGESFHLREEPNLRGIEEEAAASQIFASNEEAIKTIFVHGTETRYIPKATFSLDIEESELEDCREIEDRLAKSIGRSGKSFRQSL